MNAAEVESIDAERLAAAMTWARERMPYVGVALFSMVPVAAPGLGTVAVDRHWRLYVDPEILSSWSVPGMGTALLHEVAHLLREHCERAEAANATRAAGHRAWNLAADAVINAELDTLPDRVWPLAQVMPRHLPGCSGSDTVEQAYARLTAQPPRRGHLDASPGADCGSGADAAERSWEQGEPDKETAPGLDDTDARAVRNQVAAEVRSGRDSGAHIPVGWLRWAADVLEPVVDWRRVLTGAVRLQFGTVAGRRDYTYARPSRRATSVPGVVLPAMRAPQPPSVAVVVDTSASIVGPLLDAAIAEVEGVLRALGSSRHRSRVIACDAQAYDAQRVDRVADVRLRGGGGTDLRAGIAAAAALRPPPGLVVVLTDGCTPWPERPPPGLAVIVVLLAAGAPPPPAWTRVIDAAPQPVARR